MPIVYEIGLDMLLHKEFREGFAKDGVPTSVRIGEDWYYRASSIGGLDASPARNLSAAIQALEVLEQFEVYPKKAKLGSIAMAISGKVARTQRPYFGRHIPKKILQWKVGGRSEVFSESGNGHVVEYDMKEAYPTALSEHIITHLPKELSLDAPYRDNSIEYWDCTIRTRGGTFGPLPIRQRDNSILYPNKGIIRGIFLNLEVENATLWGSATIDKIHHRYRIKTRPEPWVTDAMVSAKEKSEDCYKCLKRAFVNAVGILAYKGGGGHRIFRTREDIPLSEQTRPGDICISFPDVFSRKQEAKEDSNPYWYRPLQANLVWGIVRAKMLKSLAFVDKPLACHVDGILAIQQDKEVPYMREKVDYGNVTWECPHRGWLIVNGTPIKTPGVKK